MWNWGVWKLGYAANKQQIWDSDQKGEFPDGLGFWTLEWVTRVDVQSFNSQKRLVELEELKDNPAER